jgi:hypothetical protein
MIGPLSKFAFDLNLRRYTVERIAGALVAQLLRGIRGRGLHSFPIQLNLSSSVYRITGLSS